MHIIEHHDRAIVLIKGSKTIAVARKNAGGNGWMLRCYIGKPWEHSADHFIKSLRGSPSSIKGVKTKAEARAHLEALTR